VSVKDDFVKSCVRQLFRDGITKRSLELYLRSCWSHGAHTALISPGMAMDALPEQVRGALTLKQLEGAIEDHLEELGTKATRKAIETVAREMLDNDSRWPVAQLSAEDDWLVGRRSAN
jgi:hypothetical protein